MKELMKIRRLYKLKEIKRKAFVGKRHESPAEHSWSCLILADCLIEKTKINVDRLKVYELLMYHDVVEIETGDIPIHHEHLRKGKEANEMQAAHKIMGLLPKNTGDKFLALFKEFEEQKTVEARFAKAIDAFDAIIHELDYKKDWKGWTEEMIKRYHGERISHFPELKDLFEEIIVFIKKEQYI
jgi:putative hydrolases of HD superfamily